MPLTAGQFLKSVRQRLSISTREVEKASEYIASEEKNPEFYISASRLNQIENESSFPSFSKLFSLCAIYGLDFYESLCRYGVNPNRVHFYSTRLAQTTRLVSADIHGFADKVMIPARLDPTFRLETTQLINRAVAMWGEIPAAFLLKANPRRHTYGCVGLSDSSMYPVLRPGSLLMIDTERRRIQADCGNEFERPIYFLEFRNGYRCAWCQKEGMRVLVLAHPMSKLPIESFSLASEVEVVGQVVDVAMSLIRRDNPIAEPSPESPEPSAFGK
jgi:transcriptional regulator with XRE-family HTH domain